MSAEVGPRRSAFAAKAAAPGGVTLEAAVAAGDRRLQAMKGEGVRRVDALLAALRAIRPPAGGPLAGEAKRRGEVAAAELAGLGGLFGLRALGEVAGALSEHLAGAETVSSTSLGVFLDAAALVRGDPQGDVSALLQELKQLARR